MLDFILDNSDPKNLILCPNLESFSAILMVLEINGKEITMPIGALLLETAQWKRFRSTSN